MCIPNYVIAVKPSEPPWLTTEVKRGIRVRKRAYKKAKQSQSLHHWEKFRLLRNKATTTLRKSKETYFNNLAQKLKNENLTSKDWWKVLKYFISSNTGKSIPPLLSNNSYIDSDLGKANLLNEFFQQQTQLNGANRIPPDIPLVTHETLNNFEITPIEVEHIFKCLPLGKASGPDEINNSFLRETASEISPLYIV